MTLHNPTVFVVDDDFVARILLEQIFESADLKVKTYASAEDFLACFSAEDPGCCLLDIMMPGMTGLELQQALEVQGSHTPVIFLSGMADVDMTIQAFKAGALDFIEKPVVPKNVLKSVQKAIALDKETRYDRMLRSRIEQKIALLSHREREVMEWMIKGKTNKEIARILSISSRTVEVHRKHIMTKMQAETLAELVRVVLQVNE